MDDWRFLSIQPVSEGDTVAYVLQFLIFCCFNFWVLKYCRIVYQLKSQASVRLYLYPLDDFKYGRINFFCLDGTIQSPKVILYLTGQVCHLYLSVSPGSNLKIELLYPFIVFVASVPAHT